MYTHLVGDMRRNHFLLYSFCSGIYLAKNYAHKEIINLTKQYWMRKTKKPITMDNNVRLQNLLLCFQYGGDALLRIISPDFPAPSIETCLLLDQTREDSALQERMIFLYFRLRKLRCSIRHECVQPSAQIFLNGLTRALQLESELLETSLYYELEALKVMPSILYSTEYQDEDDIIADEMYNASSIIHFTNDNTCLARVCDGIVQFLCDEYQAINNVESDVVDKYRKKILLFDQPGLQILYSLVSKLSPETLDRAKDHLFESLCNLISIIDWKTFMSFHGLNLPSDISLGFISTKKYYRDIAQLIINQHHDLNALESTLTVTNFLNTDFDKKKVSKTIPSGPYSMSLELQESVLDINVPYCSVFQLGSVNLPPFSNYLTKLCHIVRNIKEFKYFASIEMRNDQKCIVLKRNEYAKKVMPLRESSDTGWSKCLASALKNKKISCIRKEQEVIINYDSLMLAQNAKIHQQVFNTD